MQSITNTRPALHLKTRYRFYVTTNNILTSIYRRTVATDIEIAIASIEKVLLRLINTSRCAFLKNLFAFYIQTSCAINRVHCVRWIAGVPTFGKLDKNATNKEINPHACVCNVRKKNITKLDLVCV